VVLRAVKKVANLGKAWAVVRGRLSGNKEKSQGILNSLNPMKRREIGKQQAAGRVPRRKKAYRLGERLRRKS
jgi:hypothetical protein